MRIPVRFWDGLLVRLVGTHRHRQAASAPRRDDPAAGERGLFC